jgi:ubiquinone/menaquinone biosynthesis C-methylase UbiE
MHHFDCHTSADAEPRTSGCGEDVQAVSNCYGVTTNATLRLLIACNWGPVLMNLGYFPFGTLRLLNSFANLMEAQVRLVAQSIALLDVGPGHRVVDIACGRGKSTFMLDEMHPHARHVVGIDLLPTNIQVARTAFGESARRRYLEGDATQLPFPADSFERAISIEAAFHFPDRAKFVGESARVLRPGGRLVVVDFVWADELARRQRDHELMRTVRNIWHWEDLSTLDEYREHARAAGMELTRTVDWSRRVTDALQQLFERLTWLAGRTWGRRLLGGYNPQLRGMSDEDWRELALSAKAHRFARSYSKYVALVFDKPR